MRPMSKLLMVGILIIATAVALPPNVLAQGAEQTDHFIFATGEVGYCGLGTNPEPWTLNIAASAGIEAAVLTVEFRDADTLTFKVPADGSFSLTQGMGGVPGTDDLVRITLSGTGATGWVSARARPNATDPFSEPGAPETDNLCVELVDEGPITTTLTVPDGWVEDGDGSNGGTLQ